MLLVIVELADNITEFDGLNGIATKLLIVGLFCAFSFSKILTASMDERFSNLIIVIFALLSLSKSSKRSLILLTLLNLSTIKIELIEGMLERCDCLPVIGFIIGRISAADLLTRGITEVKKLPFSLLISFSSLVASFSGTILTTPLSATELKPFT